RCRCRTIVSAACCASRCTSESRPNPASRTSRPLAASNTATARTPAAPCAALTAGSPEEPSSPAGSVLRREVAELVAEVEVEVGGRAHHHPSPAAVVRGVVGDVAQPVLRAQLLGKAIVDAVELRHVLEEMGLAAGGPPERREEERRLVRVERPRGGRHLAAVKADAVHTDPRALGEIEHLLVGDGGSG